MRHIFVILTFMLLENTATLAHPGALSEYPERIPGKTLQQIKAEWEPLPKEAWSEHELFSLAQEIAEKWQAMSAAVRKAKIEQLSRENRQGDYRKRFANLANDLMDLQPGAADAEVSDYLASRMDHLASDDGYLEEMPIGSWDEKPEQKDQRTRQWQEARDKESRELAARADTASSALRPHWLVQCGALEFKHRRYERATMFFQRVLDAFPQHPRAEAAQLMLARIRFDEWLHERRKYIPDNATLHRLQDAWWSAAKNYRAAYPHGRFGIDLQGWEGGYDLENDNIGGALTSFLNQSRDTDHPEVRRRAFQQIEWMLRHMIENPGALETLPWDEIAREPVVALRMGYFMLDCRSETDLGAIMQRRSGGDHRVLESLAPDLNGVRSASMRAWPMLDAALARNEAIYVGEKSVIRQTLHAWSALVRNQPGVALGMLETAPGNLAADDRALVHVFALIKAAKHAEAVRAIESFCQTHADSPLNRGMLLRLADSWVDLGQPHTTVSLLWDMLEGKETAAMRLDAEEDPALNLPGEVEQRFAALLTYAPLDQLAKAADAAKERPKLRAALCGALRIRHLSEWQFDECLKWSADSDFEEWCPYHSSFDENAPARASRWRSSVLELQSLTSQAKNEPQAWIAIGNKWRSLLWKMLDGGTVYLPQPYFMANMPAPSHELRHHASYLHVSDAFAADLLDKRQELSHARRCFEQAAKISKPDSAEAKIARGLLHDVLRQRAEFSPYFRDRAVEIGDAELSQDLAATLPEAVPWTFRAANTMGEWKPGWGAFWRVEMEMAEKLGLGPKTDDTEYWQHEMALKRLMERSKEAITNGTTVVELSAIHDAVKREAPIIKSATLLNHLEDLSLLLSRPEVSRECFTAYATSRLDGKPMSLDDTLFADVKDFVSFWNAVITPSVSNREQESWRKLSAMAQVERMTQFLADYPKSPKREAALARLAINTLRQFRCHCALVSEVPVEKATTSYAGFAVERGLPFDLKSVLMRIGDYTREFPNGRYQAEMRLIRGLAAAEAKDWKTALTDLVAILSDSEEQDLHLDASNSLCAIFMELLEPQHRIQVKTAIEAVPNAKEQLLIFMHTSSCGWRLRIIEDWIQSWPLSKPIR